MLVYKIPDTIIQKTGLWCDAFFCQEGNIPQMILAQARRSLFTVVFEKGQNAGSGGQYFASHFCTVFWHGIYQNGQITYYRIASLRGTNGPYLLQRNVALRMKAPVWQTGEESVFRCCMVLSARMRFTICVSWFHRYFAVWYSLQRQGAGVAEPF